MRLGGKRRPTSSGGLTFFLDIVLHLFYSYDKELCEVFMFEPTITRMFRLSPGGVECDEGGLRVGGVALMRAKGARLAERNWQLLPARELDAAMTRAYGLPVNALKKSRALAIITDALNNGDIARAQIVTLLMRLPEPAKHGDDVTKHAECLEMLAEADILVKDWDPDAHPRTEEAPNPGWFAPKGNPNNPNVRVSLAGERGDCFRICSDLALPTADFGISFQRCVLACTSGGNSGFPEWDGKFKR